jgi:hypothetical protein
MLASDERGGRRIFRTVESDAEGVAIIADDLERGLQTRRLCLMHGAKLITHHNEAATTDAC